MMDGDSKLSFRQGLSAAIFAKNTLLNVYGFSPMQVVFGKQPRIPGAAHENKPPANEEMTDALPVFERLKSIFEARKAFTQVENSSRLKKALKVRAQKMEHYVTGEKVFYKFGADPRWHGPGTIIGTDNKVIFLRHGGNIISTSQSRIMKVQGYSLGSTDQQMHETQRTRTIPVSSDARDTENENHTGSNRCTGYRERE